MLRRFSALLRQYRPIIGEFLRFGIVGGIGFLWDWGTVTALRPLVGLTAATLLAYFVAATANWVLNRVWTFRHAGRNAPLVLQWLRFLLANALGFFLNRGTVYVLYLTVPLCRDHPGTALAAGALAGMTANFNLSRKLVFRARPPQTPLELARIAVELPGDPIAASARDAQAAGLDLNHAPLDPPETRDRAHGVPANDKSR